MDTANVKANFHKQIMENDGNQYSGSAMINVISYDRRKSIGLAPNDKTIEDEYDLARTAHPELQSLIDHHCQRLDYSSEFVDGPHKLELAATTYRGYADKSGNGYDVRNSDILAFTGIGNDQTFKIKMSGVAAVCYCGVWKSGKDECLTPNDWVFAGFLMVRGPSGGQTWTLPTEAISKLELIGSGFRNGDIMRIVRGDTTCDANSNDPPTSTDYKLDCPSTDGSSCYTATDTSVLVLQTTSKMSVGYGIKRLIACEGCGYAILEFNGDIQNEINELDTLMLEKSDILLDGLSDGAWDEKAWEEVDRVTNNPRFSDAVANGDKWSKTNPLGWKVSFVSGNPRQLKIPYEYSRVEVPGHRSMKLVTFVLDNGGWYRSNRISTAAEIKGKIATNPDAPLRVCWGVQENGSNKFYHEAGTVVFEAPSAMAQAKLALTTVAESTIAPVVLSFSPSPSLTDYSTYAGGHHIAVLRFKNVEKLEPMLNEDIFDTYPGEIPADEEIAQEQARQSTCGMLFVELWSNDKEGFPIVKGCYYGKKHRDKTEDVPSFQWREFLVLFDPQNGIKHHCVTDYDANTGAPILGTCQYQLVFNARIVNTIQLNEQLVDIYTRCDDCKPQSTQRLVFEKGTATSSLGSKPKATSNQHALTTFQLQGDAERAVDLAASAVIEARLVGGSGIQSIKSNAILRLYLAPLTAWAIGYEECSATCINYPNNNNACGG